MGGFIRFQGKGAQGMDERYIAAREKGTAMRTINWRLVLEVTAMVAMMLFASYVEGTVPVWAR